MSLVPALFGYQGRLSRRDYWRVTWQLNWAFALVFPGFVGLSSAALHRFDGEAIFEAVRVASFAFAGIFAASFFWIASAMAAKRCHDRGLSGGWVTLFLLPYAGGLIFFGWIGARRGMAGANVFGPDPFAQPEQ